MGFNSSNWRNMIQLKALEIKLLNLKQHLEDAKRNDRSLDEINEVRGRIRVTEILIEKRKDFIRRGQCMN
jgi:hypothetical protein